MGAWVLAHAIEDIWAIHLVVLPADRPRQTRCTPTSRASRSRWAGTIYAWRRQDYFKFCTEVVVEISQVTWPTRS